MKCFCFSNWQTASVFTLLKSSHARELKRMLDEAQGEAAESHVSPEADDSLVDDDGRVTNRLSEKIEQFVEGLIEERFDMLMEGEALDDIAKAAFEQIDYYSLTNA